MEKHEAALGFRGSLYLLCIAPEVIFHVQREAVSFALLIQSHLICEMLFPCHGHMTVELPKYWVKDTLIWHDAIGRKHEKIKQRSPLLLGADGCRHSGMGTCVCGLALITFCYKDLGNGKLVITPRWPFLEDDRSDLALISL